MKAQQLTMSRFIVFVVVLLVLAPSGAVPAAAQSRPSVPAAHVPSKAEEHSSRLEWQAPLDRTYFRRAAQIPGSTYGYDAVYELGISQLTATITKTVTPTGQVEYGDGLTYTLVISAAPGVQLGFYDPLTGTTFTRFVERPTTGVITYTTGAVTGTLTVTPTNQVTISFAVQVDFPGTPGQTGGVTNCACIYPPGGTLGGCTWSNEVSNLLTRKVYLPLVMRNYTPLRADFTAWPTSGPAPLTVVFTNTSTGAYTTSLWHFGDGITSTQTSPVYTYTALGAYTVTLTVSELSGTIILPGGASTLVRPNYITVITTTPPYTPSNPAPATGAISQSVDVDLSWTGGDPDGDAATYDVYLGASDPPTVCVSASQSITSYDPGTLISNTHYYWQIVATDEHGATTGGPVWDFTTSNVPAAPSGLQATVISFHQIELVWQDNSSNETGFTIYDGSDWVANTGAGTISYTVAGLEAGSYHCFRVYAFNDYGSSAWSDWACATTSPCDEGIANGGFENDSDWEILSTAYPATYTTAITRTGDRSMRAGIVEPGDNRKSYSSVRQTVTIPADVVSATLRFWLYPVSGEPPANLSVPARPLAATIEEAVLASDRQYVLVLNEYDDWIRTLVWQRTNDQQWTSHQFDMGVHAGRTIKLQFGVYNDGVDGVTAMYVDDVSLELCGAATQRNAVYQQRWPRGGILP